jgi:hypothetical protein
MHDESTGKMCVAGVSNLSTLSVNVTEVTSNIIEY